MKLILAGLVVLVASSGFATVRYVNVGNLTPAPPYTNWSSAAVTIQAAVDAAVDGDLVLVTNGVYLAGGQSVFGANRVAVTKAVTVQSVNGPAVTVIRGAPSPSLVRCVFLTNNASVIGFTLTNGGTSLNGGGVRCTTTNAVIADCVLVGNQTTGSGGGAWFGTLNNCVISNNTAVNGGGGAHNSVLNDCIISGNVSSSQGGGLLSGRATGCRILGNQAQTGGGSHSALLNNCLVQGNTATSIGGGTVDGDMNHCTVVGNFADSVGGAYQTEADNSIIYYNYPAPNFLNNVFESLRYSCADQPYGPGNITNAPQLASTFRLSPGSPCRNTGNALYSSGLDLDGEPWTNPPSMGCDELYLDALTGELTVAMQAAYTTTAPGVQINFIADIAGVASSNWWEFGDGAAITNVPFVSHAWDAPGDYPVILRAFNNTHPDGISATTVVHVVEAPVHHVDLNSPGPVAPYLSWATAATNIQDAVNASTIPGAVILVTNGTYRTGFTMKGVQTRVVVLEPRVLRSVNGPEVTLIEGGGLTSTRCVYLTNQASLIGFTLTNGNLSTTYISSQPEINQSGGGIFGSRGPVVSNCVIVKCSAAHGGGAYGVTLIDSTIRGNTADAAAGLMASRATRCDVVSNTASIIGGLNYSGGGAGYSLLADCLIRHNSAALGGGTYFSTLRNCTVVSNSASQGGGIYDSQATNSIVYYNFAGNGQNYYSSTTFPSTNDQSALHYCCSTPRTDRGWFAVTSFTNPPQFLAPNNYRLQSNSPCISSGNNAAVAGSIDLDGNPRIFGPVVDAGAYEVQLPGSGIPFWWLQRYALPLDGSIDFVDADSDQFNTWQEWRSNTNPTNALSFLRMLTPARTTNGLKINWSAVFDVTYCIDRGTNLAAAPVFHPWKSNLTIFNQLYDSETLTNAGPFFYRVRIQ